MISADDDLQEMSPMHGDGFEQELSDDDRLAASTVSWATVRSKDLLVRMLVSACPDRRQFLSWISLT